MELKEPKKKSYLETFKELLIAIVFALIIATIVRQMWFEPYEIPTGSMRPTFKEKDHLTVSKTAFGINVPLQTKHFYFDPSLVERTGIVIFSGDGVPLPETETTYFYLFPYTKRYIKRLMGKPGDSFYFYGGQIYAVDKEGNPIDELLNNTWIKNIEHIPFLSFQGQISSNGKEQYLFRQMQRPVGRVTLSRFSNRSSEIFDGKNWVPDNPNALKSPHQKIETYSDFLGMKNFAMTRLLTKEDLKTQKNLDLSTLEEAPLYLEISHSPTLKPINSEKEETLKRADQFVSTFKTILPLKEEHLKKIMENIYTARFVVKDKKAARYSNETVKFNKNSPDFKDVEDGTYELYFGKAYKIGFGGIATLLDQDHPLYKPTIENIQRLYNLGIEFNNNYIPSSKNPDLFPNRYGYFKNGDFYLLGGKIFDKNDPILIKFLENESLKEQKATSNKPYIAFKDYGPPLKDGKLDIDTIKTFGMTIPDKMYLVLGDNHAMSADSRVFGFVPENNLQGVPSLILWPPGDRFGTPLQKPYPVFVLPRLIIWGTALLVLALWYFIHKFNQRK